MDGMGAFFLSCLLLILSAISNGELHILTKICHWCSFFFFSCVSFLQVQRWFILSFVNKAHVIFFSIESLLYIQWPSVICANQIYWKAQLFKLSWADLWWFIQTNELSVDAVIILWWDKNNSIIGIEKTCIWPSSLLLLILVNKRVKVMFSPIPVS